MFVQWQTNAIVYANPRHHDPIIPNVYWAKNNTERDEERILAMRSAENTI